MEAHGPSGVGELLQAVKRGLELAWHNALPHGSHVCDRKDCDVRFAMKRSLSFSQIPVIDTFIRFVSGARQGTIVNASVRLHLEGGRNVKSVFLISQSHTMMQFFNWMKIEKTFNTKWKNMSCVHMCHVTYVTSQFVYPTYLLLPGSSTATWAGSSRAGRSGCAELLFDESRLSSKRQGPTLTDRPTDL